MYDLSGKTAIVTGAGGRRGIGRAIATRFAREGANVVVTDIEKPPLPADEAVGWRGIHSVVAEITDMGRDALGVYSDVSDAGQVADMARQTIDRFGTIDILVCNAGSQPGGDRRLLIDLEEDAFDLVQRVNVKGTFLCCREVGRHMVERGGPGKIIILSSQAGKQGYARYAAYCASKFALVGLTQALALEMAAVKVNVNAICPGLVDTERVGFTKSKNQRYRCRDCGATFTDSPQKPLGRHTTDLERATMAFTLLTEGMSVRAISRVTGLHKGTILSLLEMVADKCRTIFDRYVQDVTPRYVQADEIWTFVHTKAKRVKPSDPLEYGDAYVWIALDSETKAVLAYHVGTRDGLSGYEFVQDLGNRIREQHRFQFTSDGHDVYPPAIEERFGADIDFAQLIKNYSPPRTDGPDWFRPSARVVSTTPKFISGSPKISRISTSHIERANLTVRMQLRRFTRLTNGFSKKLANLKAMVDVFFVWYNFCRVHQTIRMTPAMEAGWTDHVWSISELLVS